MKFKDYSLNDRIARTEALYEALDEAAYEGNLGISEVASFYMNADADEIAQFEAAMESGDETSAWDIVQRFTGTNLVGIGSDIEADDRIAKQVAESFNRGRKVLSMDMIYQLVSEAIAEKQAPIHKGKVDPANKKIIVDDLISNFSSEYPDAEPKLNSKTQRTMGINNLGGRFERKDFAEKAKEYLIQKYDLEDSDVILVTDDQGVVRQINITGIKISLHQGGGSSGSEATKFEANLLLSLLGGTLGDETFKSFGDGINQDPRWQQAADAVVAGLKNPTGAPSYASPMPAVDPATTSKSSGGGIQVSLTEVYKRWGATSTEAKADLLINGLGTSVKKKEESQFMSTQGPECAAVFDVVMKKHPQLTQEMAQKTDVFLTQLKRVMGTTKNIDKQMDGASDAIDAYVNAKDPASDLDDTFDAVGDSKGMSQAVRTKVAKDMEDNWDELSPETRARIAGTSSDGSAKDPTAKKLAVVAQKQLTQLLYIDCGGDIDPTENKIFDTAVKNAGVAAAEPFVEMAASLKSVLDTDTFRVGVMKEGLTGDGKFETDSAKAKAILKWSVGSPESSYWVDLMDGDAYNDEVFAAISSGLKLGIRDRGSGRGLAMRGDAIASQACKADELKESDVDSLLPLVSAERLNLSVVSDWMFTREQQAQIQADAGTIYESVIGDELLTEQLMEGWFTDLLDKGVDVVSRGVDWVKNTFKKVMKLISNSIAKLANWFKSILSESFSTFMKAFGYEPENSAIEIPLP